MINLNLFINTKKHLLKLNVIVVSKTLLIYLILSEIISIIEINYLKKKNIYLTI